MFDKKNICTAFFCVSLFSMLMTSGLSNSENTKAIISRGLHLQPSDSASDKEELQINNIRKILTGLFSDYLLIKNSLSKNDSVTAQTQAKQFLEKIKSSADKMEKNSIPRNWLLFMKYAPEAKSRIESTSSLTEQRYFFGILSKYMIDFVKLYGMKNKTVYIFQCRSTAGGTWMSDFNDGKNPYLGPGNENCIDIIESRMY